MHVLAIRNPRGKIYQQPADGTTMLPDSRSASELSKSRTQDTCQITK